MAAKDKRNVAAQGPARAVESEPSLLGPSPAQQQIDVIEFLVALARASDAARIPLLFS